MRVLRRVVIDSQLVTITVLLSVFGLAMVYSAGQTDIKSAATSAYKSQALWLLIGLASAFGLSRLPVRFIQWVTWPAYLLTLLLLMSLLVLGVGSGANGHNRSWLAIGGHRLGQAGGIFKLSGGFVLGGQAFA